MVSHDSLALDEILFNEETRLVAVFKDYLLWDEVTEFLGEAYTTE